MPAKDNTRKHLAQAYLRGDVSWDYMVTNGNGETTSVNVGCQNPVCPCGCCNKSSSDAQRSLEEDFRRTLEEDVRKNWEKLRAREKFDSYPMKGYPTCEQFIMTDQDSGYYCVKPKNHCDNHDSVYARSSTDIYYARRK